MYAAVPMIVPASVSARAPAILARPKSAILARPSAVEEDVRRLQVTMDEAALVRVREARGDLLRDPAGLPVRQRAAGREPVLERAARQVLEDHVRALVCLPVVEELADVGMRERGDRPRLPLEAGAVGVGRDQLDGDPPSELAVLREPDRGHGAAAERLLEVVAVRDRPTWHRQ